MSKHSVGNANQRWIANWLTERGWIVRNFPAESRVVRGAGGAVVMKGGRPLVARKHLDVWGADLVARKDNALLWIQSSGSSGVKKRVEEFRKYFSFLLIGEHLQLWTKVGPNWNVKEISITEETEPTELGKIMRRKFYSACGWEF